MKIVIVGADISGCTAYLSLQKHLPQPLGEPHSYTIYETYNTSSDTTFQERPTGERSTRSATLVVGGGLGVGPNDLNVLKRLDDTLFCEAVSGGYPYSKFKIKSAYGWTLMDVDATAEVDGQTMNSVAMSRHSIWKALRDRIPGDVIGNKKVAQVFPRRDVSGRHLITFVDGSDPIEADLMTGADGLKSTVKRALFDAETAEQDPFPPQYEGLSGVGGFHPVTESLRQDIPKGSMTITFGGNGFFGYVYSSSSVTDGHRDSPSHLPTLGDTITWWSTFGADECPDPKNMDKAAINQDLKERHTTWNDPVIREIVASVEVETMWPRLVVSRLKPLQRRFWNIMLRMRCARCF